MWLCLSDDLQPLDPRSHLLPRESPRMNSLTLQWRIWVTILNIFLVFSYSFRLYSILQIVVVDSAWTASRLWPAMMIVCKCTRVILFITAVTILLIIIPPDWNRTITVSSLAPPQALPRSLLRRWSGWSGWLGVMSLPQQYLRVCVPFDFSSVASVTWLLLLLLLLPNNIIRFL